MVLWFTQRYDPPTNSIGTRAEVRCAGQAVTAYARSHDAPTVDVTAAQPPMRSFRCERLQLHWQTAVTSPVRDPATTPDLAK